MEQENQVTEYKSIQKVKSGDNGIRDLATTCVCLANGQGGSIWIGIEDKAKLPPVGQVVEVSLINDTLRKLRSRCFNVGLATSDVLVAENGGMYFIISVFPSLKTIATTSDGKIYIRAGEECVPARSEDLQRIATEKDSFQWELQPRGISLQYSHQKEAEAFAAEIRKSPRVKDQVKGMDNLEICEHYNLIANDKLTNLGVLWLGTAAERLRLAYPITVQYIVYDDFDNKIRKEEWHDCTLNPKDMIIDIEKKSVELTYFHEFPYGLFRKQIRHYDSRTVRELLVNAIAHKSYTISADIMIKVYPDRMEIENPGGLPLGITKENILHKSHRRNPHLIRVLHDLGLMEGEGTGYNLLYEISSRDAKPFPELISSFDRMMVIQSSKILDEDAVLLLDFVSRHYTLTQKEFIVTGMIARHKKLLSTQLARELQLTGEERLRGFVGSLLEQGILINRGIKKGTEYLINPKLIANAKIDVKPTLKIIEPHRLEALIEEDLRIYPKSSMENIKTRLEDVTKEDIQKTLYRMVRKGVLEHTPDRTYRKYWLVKKNRSEVEH